MTVKKQVPEKEVSEQPAPQQEEHRIITHFRKQLESFQAKQKTMRAQLRDIKKSIDYYERLVKELEAGQQDLLTQHEAGAE